MPQIVHLVCVCMHTDLDGVVTTRHPTDQVQHTSMVNIYLRNVPVWSPFSLWGPT